MLEVAYERNIRRIAADVEERPRGSFTFAVGRSAEVRAAVEATLEERGIAVTRVALRDDEGPWAQVLEASRQQGGKLFSVAGLGDMTGVKRDNILGHMNLGRELRVANRLHVLLWVGGLDQLDYFRTTAPDLWGHRSGVALFLSSADFEIALKDLGSGDVPKSMEMLLQETEEELASLPRPARMVRLLTEKVALLTELGRMDEALHTAEDAERILAERSISEMDRATMRPLIVLRKLSVLRIAERAEAALQYAISTQVGPTDDPLLRHIVNSELGTIYAKFGHVASSLACYSEALTFTPMSGLRPSGGRGADLASRALLFVDQGALDAAMQDAAAATDEVDRLRARSEADAQERPKLLSWVDEALAKVSLARGDTPNALSYSHRSLARVVGLGYKRGVGYSLEPLANAYRHLGLFSEARRFARLAIDLSEHSSGELARWTRWLGARDRDEHNRDAAIARYESAISHYRAARGSQHQRAAWLREAASVLYEDLARLTDASLCFQHAEVLLTRAARAADEAASPEQRALTRRSRAALARATKDWDRAEAELRDVLSHAEANWGPYKRAKVLLDLARVLRERGDLARAAEQAEHARREVALDPPEHRNRYTGIDAARELARIRKEQGDPAAAHQALQEALAIAEGDRLRLREREVRLDLAEVPLPGAMDERIAHAQRARTIAQDAAFPVDEAEAMLVLAELYLEAGSARRAGSLFEQAIWIVDRIGPPAVRERASRVRAKLDT